ncbi:MAG: flagellar filament capping protein FliD [Phycisphaerales bacterium]|nr:flagellar filament capping protein FliD [Phycisphaerales bacterium]
MGSFTTGIGLISGLDSASIIEYMLQAEGRGRLRLQSQIASLQGQQAAMLGINSNLLSLRAASQSLVGTTTFGMTTATSSAPDVLTAMTGSDATPGTWSFMVSQLATHHQMRSAGFASASAALGLESFSIDFGVGGSLRRDTDLSMLNGGDGVDRGHVELIIGSDVTQIDLTDVVTLQDVVDRIEASGADVEVACTKQGLRITARNGEAVTCRSLGASTTAEDLGLTVDGSSGVLDGAAIVVLGSMTQLSSLNDGLGVLIRDGAPDLRITTSNGTVHDITIPTGATTLGEVFEAIESGTDGSVQAGVSQEGLQIQLIDLTGSGGLIVESTGGNASAASDLGLAGTTSNGNELMGLDVLAGSDSVLLSRLNTAGDGLTGSMNVRDQNGMSLQLNFDPEYMTVRDMLDGFNSQLDNAGVQVHFELTASGAGIRLVDDTESGASNLTVSGDLADLLGLSINAPVSSVDGVDLQHQSVALSSALSSLNGGRGIASGSFIIRDATGTEAEIVVDDALHTVDDLLQLINSKGLAIAAQVNEAGDGVELISTASETASTVALRVSASSGSSATDLRLAGEAESVFGSGARINGSSTVHVDVDAETTLQSLVEQIVAAGGDVSASLVNAGSGSTPWHLLLQSDSGGAGGRFSIDARLEDGTSLDLTTTVEAQDAVAWLGDDPSEALLLRSHSNTIAGMVPGLTIDLLSVSDDPVVVTVERDDSSVLAMVRGFVDACNAVFSGLSESDSYDTETGQRGTLFGNATVSRVQRALQELLHDRLEGGASIDALRKVGITIGPGGLVEFDEAECAARLAADPAGVAALFNAEADVDGSLDTRGFAVRCVDLLEGLTDSTTGALALSGQRWDDRIEMAQDRIDDINARLNMRRIQLESRFAAMELAIASLQSQGSALMAFGNSYASMTRG